MCWKCQHLSYLCFTSPFSSSSSSAAFAAVLFVCVSPSPSFSLAQSYFLPYSYTSVFFLTVFFLSPFPPPLSLSLFLCHRKSSGTGSPDSVLKKSLLPAGILYPTTSSTSTSSPSSSQTDFFSMSTENHHRQKHLLTNSSRGRLTRSTSSPVSPSIELISRGSDGRFMLPLCDSDTHKTRYEQPARVPRSVSMHSEREDRKAPPFVLSVDLPPCKPSEVNSSRRSCDNVQYLPHRSSYVLDQKSSYDCHPEVSSMCSNISLATIPNRERQMSLTFPVLPHIRSGQSQPSTTASTLVLQMEHERERGNLSHCLKLAQEREELEKELQKYTLKSTSMRERRNPHPGLDRREAGGYEFLWKYMSSTLPHRRPQGSKECFSLSLSPLSSSSVDWESHPQVCSHTVLPALSSNSMSSPVTPSSLNSSNHYPAPSFTKEPPLQSEEAASFSIDTLILPHLSSKHQKHKNAEAAPEGCDNSSQSALLGMLNGGSCSEATSSLSHGSISALSFQNNEYTERANPALGVVPDSSRVEVRFPEPADEDMGMEMSVDEPELEVCVTQPSRPMLYQRIASHLQHGRSQNQRRLYEDMSKVASFNRHSLASVVGTSRVLASPQDPQSERFGAVTQGSKIWDSQQRSQSLDSRRWKESKFLNPDAWINSLSQQKSCLASSCHPDFLNGQYRTSPTRKVSKSPANSPSATHAASSLPPAVNSLSSGNSPQRPVSDHDVARHYEPRMESAKWPFAYQEAMSEAEGSLEAMKKALRCVPPGETDHDVLEEEVGCYEEVPDSGGSYSSYASSGRGSMEAPNVRLSTCHLSPTLTSFPETAEISQGSAENRHSPQMELSQRYWGNSELFLCVYWKQHVNRSNMEVHGKLKLFCAPHSMIKCIYTENSSSL